MGQIQIGEATLEPIGQALLEVIDAEDALAQALIALNRQISEQFEGGAVAGMHTYIGEIIKLINSTIGDAVQKNYNDLSVLQNTFKEVDVTLGNYINNSNYRTSDFDVSISETPVGDASGHTNQTLEHNAGTQYARK
ncbi:hypothetical protein PWEIH_07676 [Listeria weihenstephanensis FSL R9-0317]|uniref:LXG domain-containing protein n=1 Tax=Listeria weihenstephanensis TaxID=1006155 RepID=A0A1S7FVW5_9LIST|nr:hypothetical protein [Listeria weihenstephanensis]AQY51529.1 hypothetical protein UE46_11115 [Listeria weihenstephanensis]EUJ39284.1 hypothetical protein PWEIH_07676 [Listeria weihenstephanensis FSL R9-0317]